MDRGPSTNGTTKKESKDDNSNFILSHWYLSLKRSVQFLVDHLRVFIIAVLTRKLDIHNIVTDLLKRNVRFGFWLYLKIFILSAQNGSGHTLGSIIREGSE